MRFSPGRPLAGPMLLAAAALALFASSAAAQGTPETFTQRLEVNVINLEVVVTDKDGQRVTGLDAGDFTLLVDGEEMPFGYFTEVANSVVEPSERLAPGLTAGDDAATSFLLFIDEVFAIKADKTKVLRALEERVGNLRAGNQVAIVAWDGSDLAVVSDWTRSRDEVLAALEKAIARPSYGLQRESERRQFNASMQPGDLALAQAQRRRDPFSLGTQERMYAGLLVDQLNGVVSAAVGAMRGLAVPPGRKAALILSGGWPMNIEDYVGRSLTGGIQEYGIPSGADMYGVIGDVANLLGYTVYGVDLPGLQSGAGADASQRAALPTGVSSLEFFMEGEVHNSLGFISSTTGGLALLNGQRVTAFDEVRKDLQSYYWLGVEPKPNRDGQRYEIEVQVKDPELRVRTRKSYVDLTPRDQVALAVRSSILFGPAQSSPELQVQVGEFQKAGRGLMEAPVEIVLPATALQFNASQQGYAAQLALILVALDDSGGQSEIEPIPLAFASARPPRPKDVVSYQTNLKVRRKTKRLAVAAYDAGSGETYTRVIDLK